MWDEYLRKREKLRLHGVADEIRQQFEEMGPAAALPLMDELLRADRADIRKLNALAARGAANDPDGRAPAL